MAAPYLSPRHLFIAYSKKLATQNSSARVKDYHAMKYRLLTELFDANIASVDLQRLPRVMERDPKDFACRSISELYHLAESYSAESYYHPTNWEDHQEPWLEQLSSTRESLRQVRRLAARMRQVYASMASELLKILNPGIGSRRIHVGRLAQLGLPAKPPTTPPMRCAGAFAFRTKRRWAIRSSSPARVCTASTRPAYRCARWARRS